MPGDPWPHDMVIRVEGRRHTLLELLWLREAYRLDDGSDVPALLVTPAAVQTDAATRADWSGRWPTVWEAALAHAVDADAGDLSGELAESEPGSARRTELLAEMVGPTWRSEVGDAALDAPGWREWSASLPRVERPHRLEDAPERRDLEPLVPAWRAGLTTIVEVPVAGIWSRRAGGHGLVVSEGTRADSAAYRRALEAWVAG